MLVQIFFFSRTSFALHKFVSPTSSVGPRFEPKWQRPAWIVVEKQMTTTHNLCENLYRLPAARVESTGVQLAGKNSFVVFCKDIELHDAGYTLAEDERVQDGPWIMDCGRHHVAQELRPFTNSWGQSDHYGECLPGTPEEIDFDPSISNDPAVWQRWYE